MVRSWVCSSRLRYSLIGHIVRISPNELSFDSAGSFRIINSSLFVKSSFYEHFGQATPVGHIRDREHSIARKRLSPGFSISALRSQESVIHKLVDQFINQLRSHSEKNGAGISMGEAFTWLTFDIVGELAFGDSFDAVKDWKSSFWLSLILDPKWQATTDEGDNAIPSSGSHHPNASKDLCPIIGLRFMPFCAP